MGLSSESIAADPEYQIEPSQLRFTIGAIQVTIYVGDIMELNLDAAAFPASVNGHGDELIVGQLLRSGGAEAGFQTLENLFKSQSFKPGSVQVALAGGGSFRYIINATTQSYERNLDTHANLVMDKNHYTVGQRQESYSTLLHVSEQKLISLTMENLVAEISKPESPIRSVATPFFGTGSWHGMHPGLSLISMLAGIERFVASGKAIKPLALTMVYYASSGLDNTLFFKNNILPVIRLGLHKPGAYETFIEEQWNHPIQAIAKLEKGLEKASHASSGGFCATVLSPLKRLFHNLGF